MSVAAELTLLLFLRVQGRERTLDALKEFVEGKFKELSTPSAFPAPGSQVACFTAQSFVAFVLWFCALTHEFVCSQAAAAPPAEEAPAAVVRFH